MEFLASCVAMKWLYEQVPELLVSHVLAALCCKKLWCNGIKEDHRDLMYRMKVSKD